MTDNKLFVLLFACNFKYLRHVTLVKNYYIVDDNKNHRRI